MKGDCRTCGTQLGYGNKTGLCRVCKRSDPELEARRIAALKMAFKSRPELREAQREHLVALNRSTAARARSGAQARAIRLWEHGLPKVDAEVRKRQVESMRERRLAHVPPDYRELYQELTRKARIPASEALDVVLKQQAADLERFRRGLAA